MKFKVGEYVKITKRRKWIRYIVRNPSLSIGIITIIYNDLTYIVKFNGKHSFSMWEDELERATEEEYVEDAI